MPGQLSFSLKQFQQAATTYRKDLLMLPIIGIQESLDNMTARPGIRYSEAVGQISGEAQFAPYKPKRKADFDLKLDHRQLHTYFGSVVAEFEPNSAISTLLGIGATKGDAQMTTPTAMHVLALIARSLSKHLNNAIWKAKRDPDGDSSLDLFDGFDTITQQEINDGKISEDLGNYMLIQDEITPVNAVDITKKILFSLDPLLRAQKETLLYCSQDFLDKYNEGYLLTHGGINYNAAYAQNAVEGSNGNLKFCPLSNKVGSKFLHVAAKDNMLVGFDQMSDTENVMVKEYEPFILTYIATMFFGVQFESIDKSRLKVIELAS